MQVNQEIKYSAMPYAMHHHELEIGILDSEHCTNHSGCLHSYFSSHKLVNCKTSNTLQKYNLLGNTVYLLTLETQSLSTNQHKSIIQAGETVLHKPAAVSCC